MGRLEGRPRSDRRGAQRKAGLLWEGEDKPSVPQGEDAFAMW